MIFSYEHIFITFSAKGNAGAGRIRPAGRIRKIIAQQANKNSILMILTYQHTTTS